MSIVFAIKDFLIRLLKGVKCQWPFCHHYDMSKKYSCEKEDRKCAKRMMNINKGEKG